MDGIGGINAGIEGRAMVTSVPHEPKHPQPHLRIELMDSN